MSILGQQKRWQHFFKEGHRSIIVPIDHGLTLGPIPGIETVNEIMSWANDPCIDGIVAHKGMIERLLKCGLKNKAIMMHLNGMCSIAKNPDRKEMLSTVEHASQLGVDAVSIQMNFNGATDAQNMIMLGKVVEKAKSNGMPVLAMLYNKNKNNISVESTRHYIRIAYELGVDAVKVGFMESKSELSKLLDGLSLDVDIFLAGGEYMDDNKFFDALTTASNQNIRGLCVGRNIFQRKDKTSFLKIIRSILLQRGDYSLRSVA